MYCDKNRMVTMFLTIDALQEGNCAIKDAFWSSQRWYTRFQVSTDLTLFLVPEIKLYVIAVVENRGTG